MPGKEGGMLVKPDYAIDWLPPWNCLKCLLLARIYIICTRCWTLFPHNNKTDNKRPMLMLRHCWERNDTENITLTMSMLWMQRPTEQKQKPPNNNNNTQTRNCFKRKLRQFCITSEWSFCGAKHILKGLRSCWRQEREQTGANEWMGRKTAM